MAEILGLGITHQPSLAANPIGPGSIKQTLKDPGLPEQLRSPSGWPENMRREWGDDDGASHAREHRQRARRKKLHSTSSPTPLANVKKRRPLSQILFRAVAILFMEIKAQLKKIKH